VRKDSTALQNFAVDEELWFGEDDDKEAESRAAASLAAVGARIVGAKPFPIAARRLDELTRTPNARIEQVVNVLESDPALSARLLRLVNSAGYGLKVRCSSVRHAAVLVGTRRLNQVATTAAILDLFDGTNGLGQELLEHAAIVGSLCRYWAVHLGLPHDELFTCGFLHDIGKLMLLDSERDRYGELLQEYGDQPDRIHLAERRMFGFDHAVLGAHVLAAWNIPEPVPRVIAFHHAPGRALQDTVLGAMVQTLRLGDLLAYTLPMQDVRAAIETVAASDAARYLDISDVQLAAMWQDLVVLRERSRARSHGEPELEAIVPKVEVPASLIPAHSRHSMLSAGPREGSSRKPSRPLHEVPAHFPCSVCAKPSYGNTCGACGGQICPEHQVGADEWCTVCVREYARMKKTMRLSFAARCSGGLVVGGTLAGAVVSALRAPDAGVEALILAPAVVVALWAVVLPVAYRLWQKLTFLATRRKPSAIEALSVARPSAVSIRSVMPPEALPTEAPSLELRALSQDYVRTSQPVLSVAPLSQPPWSTPPSSSSMLAGSITPTLIGPDSIHPRTASLAPFDDGPVSMAPLSIPPSGRPESLAPEMPRSLTPSSLRAIPVARPIDADARRLAPASDSEPPSQSGSRISARPVHSIGPAVDSEPPNSAELDAPVVTASTVVERPEPALTARDGASLATGVSPAKAKGPQRSREPALERGFNRPLTRARSHGRAALLGVAGVGGPRPSQRPAATATPGSRESA
jgi:putative nucleotidyltransferase with HDIG domain